MLARVRAEDKPDLAEELRQVFATDRPDDDPRTRLAALARAV